MSDNNQQLAIEELQKKLKESEWWSKTRGAELEDLRSRAVFKTLADRCYDTDRAGSDLFDTVNEIMGCKTDGCSKPGFVFAVFDCWVDDYDSSIEVLRNPVWPAMTREQADAILALGFGQIYESFGEEKGTNWFKDRKSWCLAKQPRDEEERQNCILRHRQADLRSVAQMLAGALDSVTDQLRSALRIYRDDLGEESAQAVESYVDSAEAALAAYAALTGGEEAE